MIKTVSIVTHKITCNDQVLELTNQRVIHWKAQESLILSDLHIGKSGHFQKSGIPIPSSVLDDDLARLKQLILHFKAKTLIIVGDLFHAEYNKDLDQFKTWLSNFNELNLKLIKGNHDRLKQSIYDQFKIEVHQPSLEIGCVKFVHDSIKPTENCFTISGHLHPGVSIRGKGRQRIKLPCFQVTNNQLILPAFSLFTGLNTQKIFDKCQNFCFTEDGIFEV